MKVLFLTEAGGDSGFGHIMRCYALSQALEEENIQTDFLVHAKTDLQGAQQIKEEKLFKRYNWHIEKDSLGQLLYGKDVIVVDSYLASKELMDYIACRSEKVFFIDDYSRISYLRGTVLNASAGAKQISYPRSKEIKYLLGPQYTLLRRAFWCDNAKEIKARISSVMITFGASDVLNLTSQVTDYFIRHHPGLKIRVVVGNDFKTKEALYEKAQATHGIEIVSSPTELQMKETIRNSDFIVTAAGQTLYEIASLGVPSVAVCVSNNQKLNISGWKELGGFSCLEYSLDLIKRLGDEFVKLHDFNERQKRATVQRSIVDGQGARRVAQEIIDGFN